MGSTLTDLPERVALINDLGAVMTDAAWSTLYFLEAASDVRCGPTAGADFASDSAATFLSDRIAREDRDADT